MSEESIPNKNSRVQSDDITVHNLGPQTTVSEIKQKKPFSSTTGTYIYGQLKVPY